MKIHVCLLFFLSLLSGCKPKVAHLSGISGINFGSDLSSINSATIELSGYGMAREVKVPNGVSLYWFSRTFVFGGNSSTNIVRAILMTHKCKDSKEHSRALYTIEHGLCPYSRKKNLDNVLVARGQRARVCVYEYCAEDAMVTRSVFVYTLFPEWKIMVLACDNRSGDIEPAQLLLVEEKND